MPDANHQAWTPDALKALMDERFEASQRAIEAAVAEKAAASLAAGGSQSNSRSDDDAKVKVETRLSTLEAYQERLNERVTLEETSRKDAVALALTATDKAIDIVRGTAERAMAKAEGAADKQYLESQIASLTNTFKAQVETQREATAAALKAVQDALTAALASSEKAIQKAEAANERRFDSVNEFRAQLADQSKTFVTKAECDLRFANYEKQTDELSRRQRSTDLQFNNYVLIDAHDRMMREWTEWRRAVDTTLVTASSKSATIYAMFAIGVAGVTLLIAMANLISRVH